MATSTTVFTPETGVGKLQVETKFKSLIKVATGKDSAYMHAKDSLTAYFQKEVKVDDVVTVQAGPGANLSDREKAEMYAKLVSDTSTQLTSHMMDLALKIETENRDAPYMLAKVVADVKQTTEATNKIATDRLLGDKQIATATASIKKMGVDNAATQATVFSKTGFLIDGSMRDVTDAESNSGMGTQYTLSTDYVGSISAMANRQATIAGSYRKDGNISFTIDPTVGSYTVKEGHIVTSGTASAGLTDAQTLVAIRQKESFDDNKVQHAVNSSANFMGLLLSSENANYLDNVYTPGNGKVMDIWYKGMEDLTNSIPACEE